MLNQRNQCKVYCFLGGILVVGQWREPPALSISKVKQKEIGHSLIENRPSLSLFLVSWNTVSAIYFVKIKFVPDFHQQCAHEVQYAGARNCSRSMCKVNAAGRVFRVWGSSFLEKTCLDSPKKRAAPKKRLFNAIKKKGTRATCNCSSSMCKVNAAGRVFRVWGSSFLEKTCLDNPKKGFRGLGFRFRV